MMKIASLYSLNFPNGKRYIGVSTDPGKRWRAHKRQAIFGSVFSVHRAIRKFGHDAIRRQILVIGPRDFILEMEARTIAAFNTQNPRYGYNMTAGGEANPMDRPEAVAKMRASLTGRTDAPEIRARKKASWTPERRAAVSAVHKGKTISAEQKAVISVKSRAWHLANPRPPAPEQFPPTKEETSMRMRASSRLRWERELGPRMAEDAAKLHWFNSAIIAVDALGLMPGWGRMAAYRAFGARRQK